MEVLVHTPPVVNGLVCEPAQVVDVVGRSQAIEHFLLKVRLQVGGHVPELVRPSPQDVRALLPADDLVHVKGGQPQPVRAVPGTLRQDPTARIVVPELFMTDERPE
ncbi:hypothetical protein ACIQVT_12685 [Streptomyces sp. NPDC100445]|uniref:hypothetical protein n=1 Tax=Streptomyces sp. NPDC100445 TaxID=3366102 RepID=UPI00381D181C